VWGREAAKKRKKEGTRSERKFRDTDVKTCAVSELMTVQVGAREDAKPRKKAETKSE
jgi:hypothetical protein